MEEKNLEMIVIITEGLTDDSFPDDTRLHHMADVYNCLF